MSPNIAFVRAWALVIFGGIAIIYGITAPNAASVMVGFGALGVEPNVRAAVNGA
jgi:hypothetical protein